MDCNPEKSNLIFINMLPNNYVQYPLLCRINFFCEAEMTVDDLEIHQENRTMRRSLQYISIHIDCEL